MGFSEFINNIPTPIQNGLSVSLVCLSIGGAVMLARSSGVQVSREEIRVERQAVRNQVELEKALQVITAQEQTIKHTKDKLNKIGQKNSSAKRLAEGLELAEGIIPKENVRKIEQVIDDSEALLNPDGEKLNLESQTDD